MITVPVQYMIAGSGAEAIADNVEEAISRGALAPGDPLPPVRELAAQLGVNANTAAAAYRLLRDRGAVETAGRRGTRVRNRPATTPRSLLGLDVPPGARDLSTGNPDPAVLPIGSARVPQGRPLLYGEPAMSQELADHARAALSAEGVPADHLAVTSGALDGIERALTAHLRPGDRVAVEDPGWANLLDLLAALGLSAEPVGVDDDGPLVADIDLALTAACARSSLTDRAQTSDSSPRYPRDVPTSCGTFSPMVMCCSSKMTIARHFRSYRCRRSPTPPTTGHICVPPRRPTAPTCASPCSPGTVARSNRCRDDCDSGRAGSPSPCRTSRSGCGLTTPRRRADLRAEARSPSRPHRLLAALAEQASPLAGRSRAQRLDSGADQDDHDHSAPRRGLGRSAGITIPRAHDPGIRVTVAD